MRSSRIARQAVRIIGAAAVSAVLFGAVGAAPAHAAHGVKTVTTSAIATKAHGV